MSHHISQRQAEPPTVAGLFEQAREHQEAGYLFEAGQLYQTILLVQPAHAEANHNLGLIAVQADQAEAGLPYLAAAIEADPARGRYWVSYIDALCHAGRQDEARSVLALATRQGLDGEEVDALAARMGTDSLADVGGGAAPKCSDTSTAGLSVTTLGALPSRHEEDALLAHFNAGRFTEVLDLAEVMTKRFPSHAFGWKALGAVHKTLGNNVDALEPMREAATLSPGDAEAHYNLGVVLQQLGHPEEAEASYRRTLGLRADYADAWLNLGVALNRMQRVEEAEDCLRKVIRLRPESVAAHGNLGAVLEAQGRLDDAEASYRQAVAICPDAAEGHFGLGRILRLRECLDEAEASLVRAIEIDPHHANAHAELALVLQERECLDEAEQHFMEALRLNPQDVAILGNRGNLLCEMERLIEAELCYRAALSIDPDDAGLYANLGKLLKNQGRLDEAEKSFRQAIQIDPDDLEVHNRLGLALHERGRLEEAEACFRGILQVAPHKPSAYSNLGCVLMSLGRLEEAADCFRKALDMGPAHTVTHSNFLCALSLSGKVDARSLFSEHVRFGERFEASFRASWPVHTNPRDPDRRLRIGFVSADFFDHAVASFIEPVLAGLAGHPGFLLHAYYNHFLNDKVTKRLQCHFTHWNQVSGWSDEQLVDRLLDDGIDILIDLSGHTGYNRLAAFARKPAPLQASWIGYPGTTGLSAMDYYLADRFVLPAGQFDDQFTEKIVRLPANAPFSPVDGAPDVNPLPALERGYITFGSFNRRDKLSRDVIALWSKILNAVPQSRMVLGGMPESGGQDTLAAWFAEEGIPRERLDFHPRSGMAHYLALHHLIDICLDTFPYNGGTTTHHALWMGVPTLTLAGGNAAARSGASILGHAGLESFVANDAADFLSKGLFWSRNLDDLATLRAGLRDRIAQSAMRRPDFVAEGLTRALRHMWKRWCSGLPTESFEVTLQDRGAVLPETNT